MHRLGVSADAVSEKITRGRLKSEVERRLSRKAIVILDSLNAIKGYRQIALSDVCMALP